MFDIYYDLGDLNDTRWGWWIKMIYGLHFIDQFSI